MTSTASRVNDQGRDDAWSQNADFWIKIIRERLDRYRTELTDPWVLRVIGDCTGKAILDAGCGEGYLTRELAKRGAKRVVGIDTCAPLIEAAREAAPAGVESTFEVGDMLDLPVDGDEFDLVVANHSINEVSEPEHAFAEFSRVLRRGGELVLLMLHPCFFSWDGGHEQSLASYGEGRVGRKPYKVAGISSPAVATARVATLETYLQGLCDTGFAITSVLEPRPSVEQMKDPWWSERAIPPKFLIVKAALQ